MGNKKKFAKLSSSCSKKYYEIKLIVTINIWVNYFGVSEDNRNNIF